MNDDYNKIIRLEIELARAISEKENALADALQSDTDTIRALYERNVERRYKDKYRAIATELFEMIRNQICLGAFQGAKLEELRSQMEDWTNRLNDIETSGR